MSDKIVNMPNLNYAANIPKAPSIPTWENIDSNYIGKGIVAKLHTDENGTPILKEHLNETYRVYKNTICLDGIPSIRFGVSIEGMEEVYDIDVIGENQYKVNYDSGMVRFNNKIEGETIKVTNYYSTGCFLIHASRIVTKFNEDGKIGQTLEDISIGVADFYAKLDNEWFTIKDMISTEVDDLTLTVEELIIKVENMLKQAISREEFDNVQIEVQNARIVRDNEKTYNNLKERLDDYDSVFDKEIYSDDGTVSKLKTELKSDINGIEQRVSSEISALDGKLEKSETSLRTDINGIHGKVEKIETDIDDTIKSKTEAILDVALGGIKAEINQTTQDLTYTKNQIENLEFGGRNLIKQSNTNVMKEFINESTIDNVTTDIVKVYYEKDNNDDVLVVEITEMLANVNICVKKNISEYLTEPYKLNQKYMMSLDVKSDTTLTDGILCHNDDFGIEGNSIDIPNTKNEWKRLYIPITFENDNEGKLFIRIGSLNGNQYIKGCWKFTRVLFERGNIPGDWCLSDSDLPNKDEINGIIESTVIDKVSGINVELEKITSKVESTEKKTTSFEKLYSKNFINNFSKSKDISYGWNYEESNFSISLNNDWMGVGNIGGVGVLSSVNKKVEVVSDKFVIDNTTTYKFSISLYRETEIEGDFYFGVNAYDDDNILINSFIDKSNSMSDNGSVFITNTFGDGTWITYEGYLYATQTDITGEQSLPKSNSDISLRMKTGAKYLEFKFGYDKSNTTSNILNSLYFANPTISEVDNQIVGFEERIKSAEIKITDDSIISTVTNSTKYKDTVENLQSQIKQTSDKIALVVSKEYVDSVTKDLDDKINEVDARVDSILNDVGGALADGVINEAEAKIIENSLLNLNKEKELISQEYNLIYNNQNLKDIDKNNLKAAYDNYILKYESLLSVIENIISDGKATDLEKQKYNQNVKDYNDTFKILSIILKSSTEAISDGKLNESISQTNTKIELLNEKIELKVESSYVDNSIKNIQDGLNKFKDSVYTKEETDSAINVAKGSIELSVSNTYETKSNVSTLISSANSNTLSSAKSYADDKKLEAIDVASADATTKSNNVLSNAYIYTDAEITKVNTTIENKAAEIKLTTDGIIQNVSHLQDETEIIKTDLDGKANTSSLTTTNNKVATLETNLSGITSRVSNVESTTNTINGTLSSHASRIASAESKITTDAIVNTVSSSAYSLKSGKEVYPDVNFRNGTNSVTKYANSNASNISITRITKPSDCPTTSTHCLEIKHIGTATPVYGGIHQSIQSRPNAIFIQKILAKLPTGYVLNVASNSMGDGYSDKWLTDNKGTGTWTEYIRQVKCGSTGSFQDGGHVFVNGGATPTASAPLTWYVAYCGLTDVTDNDERISTLKQTVSGFEFKVNNSGGANLLQNGRFLSGRDYFWDHEYNFDGTNKYRGTLSPSSQWCPDGRNCLQLRATNSTTGHYSVAQTLTLKKNCTYTVSGYGASHRCNFYVYVQRNGDDWWVPTGYWNAAYGGKNETDWDFWSYTFTTDEGKNEYNFHFALRDAGNDGCAWFTDLTVTEGSIKQKWSPHTSEIYEGIISIDARGITVTHSDTNTTTNLNSEGLSILDKSSNKELAYFGKNNSAYIDKLEAKQIISDDVIPLVRGKGNVNIYVSVGGSGNGSGTDTSNYAPSITSALEKLAIRWGLKSDQFRKGITLEGTTIVVNCNGTTSYSENVYISNIRGGSINLNFANNTQITGTLKFTSCDYVYVIGNRSGAGTNDGARFYRSDNADVITFRGCKMVACRNFRMYNTTTTGIGIFSCWGGQLTFIDIDFYGFQNAFYIADGGFLQTNNIRGHGFGGAKCHLNYGSQMINTGLWLGGSYGGSHQMGSGVIRYSGQEEPVATNSCQVAPPAPTYTSQTNEFNGSSYKSVRPTYTTEGVFNQSHYNSQYGAWTGYVYFSGVSDWLSNSTGTPTAKIFLHRKNTAHGYSTGARPYLVGYGFLTGDSTGANGLAQGGSDWFTIPVSIVNELKSGTRNYLSFTESTSQHYILFETNAVLKVTANKPN